jgi:hypothetical protein
MLLTTTYLFDDRVIAWEPQPTTRPEADDLVRHRFVVAELRPIRLTQQLQLEFQDVAQGQTAHGLRDQRLLRQNVLHVSQASPGMGRRHDPARHHT